ncbi:MAG: glutamine-hydrolyzing carbamoyl-phosphate synthase small subunit, partial [Verrucomicrobiae bacterium]|nr:glutamine-hydrolyzing carbamoyl-phosphate synthase small subunit [Verrucomicrobiae bacterium]
MALLALEDGRVFRGGAFGAPGSALGEVCFNTSMAGYQEILTDPSYKGQIVAMTYPMIGNYGVNSADVESWKPHVSGFVVRELSGPSSWRSEQSLDDYLKANKIPGLQGIDTRALTKHLRTRGAMKGLISTEDLSDQQAVEKAKAWTGLVGVDYVKEVTCSAAYDWDPESKLSRRWKIPLGATTDPEAYFEPLPKIRHRIVAYDFGIKRNILRNLRQSGFEVHVVPATTPASEVLKRNPDGVFLSNGPGDPAALPYAHDAVRGLIGKKPIFGICLGHQ